MKDLAIFLNVWAVVGPLVGVALGSWLATKNQRKHWLMDNKRAEYRKLLTTLSDCGSKFLTVYGHVPALTDSTERRMIREAARSSANVIYNRLFIASELRKLNIMDRWTNATSTLTKTHNGLAFTKELDTIMDDVRSVALKDFS